MLEIKAETTDKGLNVSTRCTTKSNLQILDELMGAVTHALDALADESVKAGADKEIGWEYYKVFTVRMIEESRKRQPAKAAG